VLYIYLKFEIDGVLPGGDFMQPFAGMNWIEELHAAHK